MYRTILIVQTKHVPLRPQVAQREERNFGRPGESQGSVLRCLRSWDLTRGCSWKWGVPQMWVPKNGCLTMDNPSTNG